MKSDTHDDEEQTLGIDFTNILHSKFLRAQIPKG